MNATSSTQKKVCSTVDKCDPRLWQKVRHCISCKELQIGLLLNISMTQLWSLVEFDST